MPYHGLCDYTGVARIFVGGGPCTPPSLASVVRIIEAVAGSWRSVSAPAVSRVMSGGKIGEIFIWGRVFVNGVSLIKYIGMI